VLAEDGGGDYTLNGGNAAYAMNPHRRRDAMEDKEREVRRIITTLAQNIGAREPDVDQAMFIVEQATVHHYYHMMRLCLALVFLQVASAASSYVNPGDRDDTKCGSTTSATDNDCCAPNGEPMYCHDGYIPERTGNACFSFVNGTGWVDDPIGMFACFKPGCEKADSGLSARFDGVFYPYYLNDTTGHGQLSTIGVPVPKWHVAPTDGVFCPSTTGPSTFSCQAIKNAYSAQQCCTNPNAIFTLPVAAGSRRAEEPKADSKDVVSKMETLSKLHKQGFLTNEEFQAQRVRLLDKLLR